MLPLRHCNLDNSLYHHTRTFSVCTCFCPHMKTHFHCMENQMFQLARPLSNRDSPQCYFRPSPSECTCLQLYIRTQVCCRPKWQFHQTSQGSPDSRPWPCTAVRTARCRTEIPWSRRTAPTAALRLPRPGRSPPCRPRPTLWGCICPSRGTWTRSRRGRRAGWSPRPKCRSRGTV